MQNNTHAGACPTWRDFAGELTQEQITELEGWEDASVDPLVGRALLMCARDMVRRNRWAVEYADVAAPADATYSGEWHAVDDIETPARYFEGFRGPHVHVGGIQNPDGMVRERWITVDTDTDDLDAATARALARFLIAAADGLEQVAFSEAVAGWQSDTDADVVDAQVSRYASLRACSDQGISYRDACKAGVAVVCAEADTFGAVL